jgi:hypothetical protein
LVPLSLTFSTYRIEMSLPFFMEKYHYSLLKNILNFSFRVQTVGICILWLMSTHSFLFLKNYLNFTLFY